MTGTFAFGPGRLPYARGLGERAVEIPLARIFYDRHLHERFVEVGAVTPYWWQHDAHAIGLEWRKDEPVPVPHVVVDPCDAYSLAVRIDAADRDLTGQVVLSISTIEHAGTGEYGNPHGVRLHSTGAELLAKIIAEASSYFVTWPTGADSYLDECAEELARTGVIEGFCFEQYAPGEFRQLPGWDFSRPYGSPHPHGNVVVVVTNDEHLLAMAAETPQEVER